MFLGPVNAVKQTVGPDRNKRIQQPAALPWFLATFIVLGKVPFFYLILNDLPFIMQATCLMFLWTVSDQSMQQCF